jgi:hypothetical protein
MIPIEMVDPNDSNALGDDEYYINVPFDCYIVYVSAGADADDTGLTLDINDDGSDAITGIDCADKQDPGEWISTHFGGSNDPVYVAADSELSFDANSAAAATTIKGYMLALSSDVYA